ncbi:MAG: molybdopterin-synthase adenylyltransferase MoeB [Robiginitomaculum sp.]
MTPEQVKRYGRHIVLREIGGAGQADLLAARIAIVGAGGLGGPAGLYLAAAGIGHITLIDDDIVEISNLQRQVQFDSADIGKAKASVMAGRLMALNPDVSVTAHKARLTRGNAQDLLSNHDIILDGTDSFESRFAVNGAALALKTPLVSGALGRFNGQVAAFDNRAAHAPCYQCFVPKAPQGAQTCSEVGVVGALAGMIGSMMAMEAVKIITGAGAPLLGRLYLYDALGAQGRTVSLTKDPSCPACSN